MKTIRVHFCVADACYENLYVTVPDEAEVTLGEKDLMGQVRTITIGSTTLNLDMMPIVKWGTVGYKIPKGMST